MARQSFISNLGGYALKKLRLLVNGDAHEYDTTQPVEVSVTSGKQVNMVSTDGSVDIDENSTAQSVTFDLSVDLGTSDFVVIAYDSLTFSAVQTALNNGKLPRVSRTNTGITVYHDLIVSSTVTNEYLFRSSPAKDGGFAEIRVFNDGTKSYTSKGIIHDCVQVNVSQEFTSEQKAQGRSNLGISENVFFATIHSTTYQAVLDAYNAGKLILMYNNNFLYIMTSHEPAEMFGFTAFYIQSGNLYTSYKTVTLDNTSNWTTTADGDVMSLSNRQHLVQSGSALQWDNSHSVINFTRLALYKNSVDAAGNTTVTVPNGVFIGLTGVSTSTLTIQVELESYAYEGQETANFVLEVTPSVNCDVTIKSNENHWATPHWVALKHDAALGNQLTANKTYQIVCRGTCWSFKEYS